MRICLRHENWNVIVVTQYEEILRGTEQMKDKTADGKQREDILRAVYSPDSVKGAAWSVRAGIEEAKKQGAEACVFFVADQPWLTEESAEHFTESMEKAASEKDGKILGCAAYKERSGNPAWFSEQYFPELMQLAGDQGGRKILQRYPQKVIRFQVAEEKELQDIDKISCI